MLLGPSQLRPVSAPRLVPRTSSPTHEPSEGQAIRASNSFTSYPPSRPPIVPGNRCVCVCVYVCGREELLTPINSCYRSFTEPSQRPQLRPIPTEERGQPEDPVPPMRRVPPLQAAVHGDRSRQMPPPSTAPQQQIRFEIPSFTGIPLSIF